MKHFIGIFLGLLMLSGCLATGPEPTGEISWDEAISVLKKGQVETVFQTHDRWVTFTTKSGAEFSARGPYLDAVIQEIGDCAKCENVGIILE